MEINVYQLITFETSLILKVQNPKSELCRNAQQFRAAFKKARGLSRNATTIDCINALIDFYQENGMTDRLASFTGKLDKLPQLKQG